VENDGPAKKEGQTNLSTLVATAAAAPSLYCGKTITWPLLLEGAGSRELYRWYI
jgi:hypothetical protein